MKSWFVKRAFLKHDANPAVLHPVVTVFFAPLSPPVLISLPIEKYEIGCKLEREIRGRYVLRNKQII